MFVHIPRTRGNSLQWMMRELAVENLTFNRSQQAFNDSQGQVHRFGVKNPHSGLGKHATFAAIKQAWNEEIYGDWEAYLRFSVIRNPWERLISFYFAPHFERRHFVRAEFADFVISMADRQQYHYLHSDPKSCASDGQSAGKLLANRLVRYECLEAELDGLRERLGLPDQFTWINESEHGPYQDYYDQELLDLVAQHHGLDLAFLDYEF